MGDEMFPDVRQKMGKLQIHQVIYKKKSDCEDDIYFTEEDSAKAEEIIKQLDGMTVSSACNLLEKVKKAVLHTVISI